MLCPYHLDGKGIRWMCKTGSSIYLFQDLEMQFQPPPWKCWAGTVSYWCRSSLIHPWRKSHHACPPQKTRRFIPSHMNHRDECCQLTQRQTTLVIGFPVLLTRDSKGAHSLWTISSRVLFFWTWSPCQLCTKMTGSNFPCPESTVLRSISQYDMDSSQLLPPHQPSEILWQKENKKSLDEAQALI